jgi:hypothetical protein
VKRTNKRVRRQGDAVELFWGRWLKAGPLDRPKLLAPLVDNLMKYDVAFKDDADLGKYAYANLLNSYFEDIVRVTNVQRSKDDVKRRRAKVKR